MARAPYMETGDAKLCTGCAACAAACPTGAVRMAEDPCGFVYPEVDEGRCVGCGRCRAACHMARPGDLASGAEPRAYGAYVTDAGALSRSASGGVATALCERALSRGGVAYGCVARRETVRHERLATAADLERARGSKYVQSDISGVFEPMRRDLADGLDVCFVGTPCQCAAVRLALGDRPNLLLVDLVCEGVPSQAMYADFLDRLESERGEAVSDFRFRDKRGGWSTKNAVVAGAGGAPLEGQPHSYYYYYWLFAHALTLRESCYACPYAQPRRAGDVTVGDLWGAETAGADYGLRELRDGISCVLLNSAKGERALRDLDGSLDLRKVPLATVARANACLRRPSSCDAGERAAVLSAYAERGAEGMEEEYRRLFSGAARVKEALSCRAPLALRVAAKRAIAKMRGAR